MAAPLAGWRLYGHAALARGNSVDGRRRGSTRACHRCIHLRRMVTARAPVLASRGSFGRLSAIAVMPLARVQGYNIGLQEALRGNIAPKQAKPYRLVASQLAGCNGIRDNVGSSRGNTPWTIVSRAGSGEDARRIEIQSNSLGGLKVIDEAEDAAPKAACVKRKNLHGIESERPKLERH